MNFVMNHAPNAGSIVRPVDQQSRAIPLYHGCPRIPASKCVITKQTFMLQCKIFILDCNIDRVDSYITQSSCDRIQIKRLNDRTCICGVLHPSDNYSHLVGKSYIQFSIAFKPRALVTLKVV